MPSSDESGRMIEVPEAVLLEALGALHQAYSTALTVRSGQIDAPYSDDPRWTPYTRWLRPMGRRTHDARSTLLKAIRATVPGYDPGWPSAGAIVALSQDINAEKLCSFCQGDAP